MATLGKNQVFEIKNGDGTSFHNLVLRKSAVESIVMSLGDKISGDVYYKDNTLSVTMHEYITYNGVNYMLINPPTIVREGVVSDNSELRGMTKYSFVFYHPMCQLSNFPFTDVAVTNDETRYLSESKTFSWIGKPADFVAKMNKNLDGTEWIVEISSRFPQDKLNELSDVIPFDNATIADACKTFYDTWGVPYVVDKVASTEASYATGKRFKLVMGLPSNEIYENASAEQQNVPFVFQMGHGVGLKNNSRTPRNNKIITRISGYGSENNIPYGYPQVRWYGTAGQSFTYGDHAGVYTNVTIGGVHFDKVVSYPIYKGILNGEYVELIKHPFTRTHLMPSVYRTTLFNKISLYNDLGEVNTDYDPDITLVDYYDAIYSAQYPYPNTINLQAPSYESHEFEDEKPELGEAHIISATPLNNDLTPASSWDDSLDDEGNYKQSYFQMVLPQLSFDLYACASITEEMQINMRSGACLGCTFTVQVDWDDYKQNFYDEEGNFSPNGSQRDLTKYPKSNQGSISLVLQKDNSTFGTLMPNMYQYPKGETSSGASDGDTFVILGISLPESYILAAEDRLDVDMKSYMLENNEHYFDYPLKFDEDFLFHNENILSQIRPNTVVRFNYAGQTQALFVKQITIKYGEQQLPQYDITLTDNVEVVLNQIGQVAEDVEKLSTLIAILRQSYGKNVWNELAKKLSKTQDDTAAGYITMLKGLQVGANFVPDILGEGGVLRMRDDGKVELVTDILYARVKAYFDSVEIREYQHTGGNRIASVAGNKICRVAWFNSSNVELEQTQANLASVAYFRCYFRASDGEDTVKNNWVVGDQAYCHITSVTTSSDNPEQKGLNQKHLWRLVVGRNTEGTLTEDDEAYIDLSNRATETISGISYTGYQSGSDIPEAQDDIIQLGNVNDTTRQGAIVEFVTGIDAPSYQIYQGINSFSLNNKNQIGFGYNTGTGKAYLRVLGDAYIGASDRSTFIEYKQDDGTQQHAPVLNIKAVMQTLPSSTYEGKSASQFVQDNQIKYDSAIQNLTNITNDLQSQIDGQVETFFYNGTPSDSVLPESEWKAIDIAAGNNNERLKHLSDLYYDNQTGYAYRYSNSGTEENPVFFWNPISDSAVIKALTDAAAAYGLANTKAKTFTTTSNTLPSPPYKTGDLWLNATGTWGSGDAAVTLNGDILKVKSNINRASGDTPLISDWELAGNYMNEQDFLDWKAGQYATDLTNAANNYLNDSVANAIKSALGSALGASTLTDGGLMLTSLIYLRKLNAGGDPTQVSDYTTWGGVSGEYDADAVGGGIAAWYGGNPVDKEVLQPDEPWDGTHHYRWARSLFRFDGSGYLADGNITWNENGALTIKNITTLSDSNNNNILNELATFNSAFTFGTSGQGSTTALYITPNVPFESLYIGTSNANKKEVATREWVDDHYVSTAFFRQLFRAFKPNATAGQADIEVEPNTIDVTISNIKAMVGFWTEQYVSALGNSSDGGGGGGGASVLYGLNDVTPNATGDGVMGAQDGYVLTYNGSTHHWYAAATAETYVLPQATANALGGIKIGYAASGKNYAIALDTNGKAYVNVPWTDHYAWSDITSKPNTIDGYGITDAKIENGVITLGSNTITPLTSHQSLADIMGSSVKGGTTQPIYWDGTAFKNTTYTLGKSVPSDAVFTNTWRNIFLDGTEELTTGINTKGLNFVGDGKTTISFLAAGTGSGQSGNANYATIKISSTWRGIQNNLTSDSTTDSLSAAQGKALKGSITTLEGYFDNGVANDAAKLNGQSADYYATADDLSTVQGYFDANGNANAALKLTTVSKTAWGQTYWTANGVPTTISGNMTNVGDISFSASGKKIGNFLYFDTTNTRLGVNISSPSYRLHVNGTFYASGNSSIGGTFGVTGATTLSNTLAVTGATTLTELLTANGGIVVPSNQTIKIGDAIFAWDSENTAIKLYKQNGSTEEAVNFYATGAISALGQGVDGGGGGTGDVTWALLASDQDTRQIAISHLNGANGVLDILTGYVSSGKNYAVVKDASNHLYVNVPWANDDTKNTAGSTNKAATKLFLIGAESQAANPQTYSHDTAYVGTDGCLYSGGTKVLTAHQSLADLMGSTAIGGTTQPVYWNGSAWVNTTYTLGKSVPADAVFTDHYAWSDITSKPLTLTKNTTGFSISGGTTSKTLTVSENYTLGAACAKGVTDNSSATAVTSTDTNLITARTLYYAGYTKNTGTVTSITLKAGTGISLDTDNTAITTSGTRTISLKSGVCTAGTYKSVTVDTYGRVTAGTNPTTLSGYGITDALSTSGGTLTGELRVNMTIQPLLLLQVNGVNKAQYGYHYQDGLIIYNYQAEKGLNISNNGVLSYDGYTIWSSGNDGSGSTLDADLLDGQHGSYYATASSLSNYLPLSGGVLTGLVSSSAEIRATGFRNTTESTFINDSCVFRGASNGQFTRILSDGIGVCDANKNGTFVIGYDGTKCYIYQNIGKHICLQASASSGYTAGNVGIGTNSPTHKLHISGNTKIDGGLQVNTDLHTTILLQVSGVNKAQFGYHNNYGIFVYNYVSDSGIGVNNSGNVIIGNVSGTASYKLHVSGDIYATGGVTCASDARMKDVIGGTTLSVEQVANAPAVRFYWKKDHLLGEQVGTLAQYWKDVLPQSVSDKSGELSLQYGVAALVAAITTARKVVDHEARIKALEKENKELREEISRLKIA